MKKLLFLALISVFMFNACSFSDLLPSGDSDRDDDSSISEDVEDDDSAKDEDVKDEDKNKDEDVKDEEVEDEEDDSSIVSDFFIDDTAVHNGLVDSMDAVLDSENVFYQAYLDIEEGDDVTPVKTAYVDFLNNYEALSDYMESTDFVSGQQIFVTQYEDVYKPSIDQYIEIAGEFVDFIDENGYTFDSTENFIDKIDIAGEKFGDIHNAFIEIVNEQADL